MADDRIALAEELLQAAVYRSRAGQSVATSLRGTSAPGAGTCGLGAKAEVLLDLSERGLDIFGRLLGESPDQRRLQLARDVMAGWVVEQDAIDRRRNHFLKEFRGRHGFDRRSYSPEVLAAHEAGLAEINGRETSARRASAERLLACAVKAS